ncbi:alpha/beta hydrolase [Aureimonas sp. ME7]|uniref:alpha/beta fold hydrolase n=1 Tax=Aureimonas sp. ME7 TaxID=2744252 RepID=UPI0015F3EA63|nr:alpha/beta hydrolase [Aureimonas sp. ME7]
MSTFEAQDGTKLFYKDWGQGRPVVLIHGWPLNADMWDFHANALADKGFRAISYDRRGFGRSDQPGSGYDYDTFAADLASLLDKLDLRDVVLVGFSMGGGEVVRYLSRFGSERVAKAVLVSAVPPYLLKDASNPDGVDRSTFDEFVEQLKSDRPSFLASFGKKFYGAGLLNFAVSSEYLEYTSDLALQASLRSTLACVRAFSETDFRADVAAVRVPALVIHGSSDQTVPLDVSGAKSAEAIAGAELKIYEGAPHGLHYTEQDRLLDDLVAFARS